MQRFHKTGSYFGQNPKRKENISSSNFHGQLPNILFTCLFLSVRVIIIVAATYSKLQGERTTCSYFDGTLNSMLGGDYF